MRSQRSLFALIAAFITLIALSSSAQAQPSGFASVTTEDIARLEAMHQQASDFLLKNDFQGAIRVYSDILLMEPDDETAYTGLGQIYMVLGQYKNAEQAFQNALHINPDNQVALVGIRQILDPDGVDGMVSRQEAEYEPSLRPIVKADSIVRLPATFLAFSSPEKRLSAAKAKKIQPTLKVEPVRVQAPPSGRSQARRASSKHSTTGSLGRLGLLHAQRMQMALKNAGFYRGRVDGMIGRPTKQAIREFQSRQGLDVTGKMSSETWSELTEYLGSR